MTRFLEFLDGLAGSGDETGPARWLDRLAFVFLTLMVVSSPHSIAASQTSWVIALLMTTLRFFARPRRKFKLRPLDIAIWAFFAWSVLSASFSYSPELSFNSLRNVILFLAYFLTAANVRNLRAAQFLAFALFFSCMVNVVKTPIERIVGRGVEIHGVDPDGAIGKSGMTDGDTILKIDGKTAHDLAPLITALETKDSVEISIHRPDAYQPRNIPRALLRPGTTPEERLGVGSWAPSHYWRALGFFNHWTTYSEALQLIGSLIFGLLVASFFYRRRGDGNAYAGAIGAFVRVVSSRVFLAVCLAGTALALLLTVTRASQMSFLVSGFVIIALSASRRVVIATIILAIPVGLAGVYMMQQSRQVGFIDSSDDSTQYRLTMWRDGTRLLVSSPRNLIFGIGMDSATEHWREWNMYDGGRMMISHFHSTPVQIAVERGIPALLLWIAILALYGMILWRGLRLARATGDWRSIGIILGCIGGAIGFVNSGFVHNNIGDSEVAMIFYLLMGLGVRTSELCADEARIQTWK
ncbi:MAG: O-antigen ligase family protein [Acidobacteriota bacterium]